MRRKLNDAIIILLVLLPLEGLALTYQENFSNPAHTSTSTLVWNHFLNQLHPPLQVSGWNDGSNHNDPFSVGDGRHGVFDTSTYERFGTIVGNQIRIDTDAYPDLQFTNFNLADGWVLRPTGSNPLIIRSLGNIHIAGNIDCSGENGQDLNTNNTIISVGGIGHCGGASGGNGGTDTVAPLPGTSGGGFTTGGGAGPAGGGLGGASGAGGGAFRQPVTPGQDGTNPNGGAIALAGFNDQDDGFSIIGGGSGGGGGFAHDTGADDSSGGGGGAGGGSIYMYAVGTITVEQITLGYGQVIANGGNGGGYSGAGTPRGGGGGGGGGGSILMFSRGDIDFLAGTVVSADAGLGGTVPAADGGNGSHGRTWITDNNGAAGGVVIESPLTLLVSPGVVEYQINTFTAESVSLDFGNTGPTLTAATPITAGVGTVTIDMDESDSAIFTPTYVLPSTLIGQELGRYFKFRVTINNTDASNPARITSMTWTYDGHKTDDFDFVSSCGSIRNLPPPSSWQLLLFLLPIVFAVWLRRHVSKIRCE